MPLIRGHHWHDDQFAQIPNEWLRDHRLSLKAIGLLAQIHTHSAGWSMSIHSLALANRISRDQISNAIKELEKWGYLKRTQERGENNRWQEITYTTCDPLPMGAEPLPGKPSRKKPSPEKPLPEKPLPENQTAKNTISKEEQIKEKQIKNQYAELFEIFWKQYPRKEAKPKAAKEFAKLSNELGADYLMQQLLIWLSHPAKSDRQYWPYAERWLRDRRFDDELPSNGGVDKSKVKGWFE
jgi:hypothetical protein